MSRDLIFVLIGMGLGIYIMPIFDTIMGVITSYYNLFVAYINVKISCLNLPTENRVMGFKYTEPMNIDDEDDYFEEDSEYCKNKNKIGY